MSVAGFSSELISLTAALMFPSSILAATAAASSSSAFLLLPLASLLFGFPCSSLGLMYPSAVLFLMIEVRLCRLPVLAGLCRILDAKRNRSFHVVSSVGLLVTLLRRVDSKVAHAGLADLGICLMSRTET